MAKKKAKAVVGGGGLEVLDDVSGAMVPYKRPDGPLDLVLGFRRLRSGPFSGLWELTTLDIDPKDIKKVTVMIDASLKRFVIGAAAKALTRAL